MRLIGHCRKRSVNCLSTEEAWGYYLSRNYDEFIEFSRANFPVDTDNRRQLNWRALAELTAKNYQLAAKIYQSYGACDEPVSYEECQYLYYSKRMMGDEEGAADYLKKIEGLEMKDGI